MITIKQEPIPYPVFDAMRRNLDLRVYSSYSDPHDQYGSGTASMYTEFCLPTGNAPLIIASSKWPYDNTSDIVPADTVMSTFFLCTPFEVPDPEPDGVGYDSDCDNADFSVIGC